MIQQRCRSPPRWRSEPYEYKYRNKRDFQSADTDNKINRSAGFHSSEASLQFLSKIKQTEEPLTCISSSFDWISGGKSADPQVNGSNGSAPNRSFPTNTDGRSIRSWRTDSNVWLRRGWRSYSLMSGGNVVGGGGGQPLLAGVGTSGVTGENGTMSKTSVDCGFMEMLPACVWSRVRFVWACASTNHSVIFYTKSQDKRQKQQK